MIVQAIDTADLVRHEPSGEEWLVAYVKGDRLAWCGWPPGEAALADCTLVKKATDEQRAKLIQELASCGDDPRAYWARAELGDIVEQKT